MEISGEDRFPSRFLSGLLLAAPLFYGAHPDWAALGLAAGLIFLFCYRLSKSLFQGKLSFLFSFSDFFILLFFVWTFISLKRSFSPGDAFLAYLQILAAAGFFLIARKMAYDETSSVTFILRLVVIASVLVVIGFFQLLDVLPHDWWNPRSFLAATFVNHNHFAAYLSLIIPLSTALWLSSDIKPHERFIAGTGSGLMIMGFILSCSRGAWISLIAAIFFSLPFTGIRKIRAMPGLKFIIAGILAAAGIIFLFTRAQVLRRFLSVLEVAHDPSAQMRVSMWKGTLELFRNDWFSGVGFQGFAFAFPQYRPPGLYRFIDYAHNEYLHIAAELGIPGLFLGLVFYFLVLKRVSHLALKSQTPWKQSLGAGGVISLVAFAFHSLLDFPWHIPAVGFQWAVLAGTLCGVSFQSDPEPLKKAQFSFPAWRVAAGGLFVCLVAGVFALLSVPMLSFFRADFAAFKGKSEKRKGHLERALHYYGEAVHWADWRSRYFQELGDTAKEMAVKNPAESSRWIKEAAQSYRRALDLAPYDSQSMNGLGVSEKLLGHFSEAESWLDKSVRNDPNNPLYWKEWAELKHLQGEAKEAARGFRRAAELSTPYNFFPAIFDPLDNAETFIAVGQSARVSGQTGYAQTAFRIAAELSPGQETAKAELAASFLDHGDEKSAREMAESISLPREKARWFSELSRYYLERQDFALAEKASSDSLQLDPSNLLAHHMRVLLAGKKNSKSGFETELGALLALNKLPVEVVPRQAPAVSVSVLWDPSMGHYSKGQKVYGGWALYGKGAIRQEIFLPPGKVHFQIQAKGTKARGKGPQMKVLWSDRMVLDAEVVSKQWQVYEASVTVHPGESFLKIGFMNDYKDVISREDRNLKIGRVTALWEPAA